MNKLIKLYVNIYLKQKIYQSKFMVRELALLKYFTGREINY